MLVVKFCLSCGDDQRTRKVVSLPNGFYDLQCLVFWRPRRGCFLSCKTAGKMTGGGLSPLFSLCVDVDMMLVIMRECVSHECFGKGDELFVLCRRVMIV